MNDLPPLNDDERAELIAYLDGELDANASRTLEARLNRDPIARAEAETLRRTWELLDYLPRTEASATFTHRTMERATVTDPALTGRHWRPWLRGLGWLAAAVLCGVGSYAAVTALAPREEANDDDLVRDLRIIENKRFYEAADDIEFLRALDHPDRFGEDSLGS